MNKPTRRPKPKPVKPMIAGRQDIAKLFAVTPRRITQLVELGMPQAGPGQYDVAHCVQWWKVRVQSDPRKSKPGADLSRERALLYRAQTERCRLEVAQIRRTHILTDPVLDAMDQLQTLMVEALDDLGADTALAEDLAVIDSPALVRKRIGEAAWEIATAVADDIDQLSRDTKT